MKYLLSAILAVTIGCSTMAAGALSPIFNEFKSEKNCTVIKIPRMAMWLAKKSCDEPIMKKINSMKVMVIEKGDSTIDTKIKKRVKELAPGLDQLVRVKEDGDNVNIWMDSHEDKINSIYVYVNENNREIVLVEFNGKFTSDDIGQLIDKANNNKN